MRCLIEIKNDWQRNHTLSEQQTLIVGENNDCTPCRNRVGRDIRFKFFSLRTQFCIILWHINCKGATCFITQATNRLYPDATNNRLSLWPQHMAVNGLP